jgi:hypothetical protein
VTCTGIKYANKGFLSWLGGLFSHFSLRVEGRILVGWVVSFGGFDCFLLLVVGGAGNGLESTLLTLILTPIKPNTKFVCGFGCTLLNPTQIILNHLLTHNGLLKTCSQIGNLLPKLNVLFGNMKKLTLERATQFTRRGYDTVARSMIKSVLKILNLNGRSLQIRPQHRTANASTK